MTAVSVVVPCFNAEPYLAETLESALAQTLPPAQIVVVDDGSTDRSKEIAARYVPAITLIATSGKGASAARNFGTAQATGEFLQYLDADDLLLPHALETRAEALERTGMDVAISDWQRLERNGLTWRAASVQTGALPDDDAPTDLLVFKGFWAPPAAILYRRSLCERIGGWRETLPVIQDARFLFDAAYAGGRFVRVDGVGAMYRQHAAGSLSSQDAPRFWRDVLVNARDVERLWAVRGELDARHRQALAGAYEIVARVGFVHDSALFDAGRTELRRFSEYARSRLVRAGTLLSRVFGYRNARRILAPFCR